MQVFLTFDYELFFGSNTGSVEKCMIKPTNYLLDMAEKHKVPMTFFVDVGYLIRLWEKADEFQTLADDKTVIERQIERMLDLGCDIQLHIHPHWEKSYFDGQKWIVKTENAYKISDFNKEESDTIIRKYYWFLADLTGVKPTAFRAGGWCVQPFSLLESTFQELNIHYDSSVFPGGKFESEHYNFDFTSVPRYSSTYRFQNDVCVANEQGFFTEIPISSWNFSPLFYWKLYGLGRLFPKQHKMMGDGSFLPQPGRKKSVLTSFTWNHVSSDGYYASLLNKQAHYYFKQGVDRFVIIGHPKGMTLFSLKVLDSFIQKTKRHHSFVNFELCD